MKSFLAAIFTGLSLADRDCAEGVGGGGAKQKQRWGGVGVEDGKERGVDKQQPPSRLCYNCVGAGVRED
jgi:hypothetical protein